MNQNILRYVLSMNIKFTAQKMNFSTKDFFSKCDQIRRFLRIWSHLLKKSLVEKFIFWAMVLVQRSPDTPERLERPLDINVKKDLQQSVLT